MIDGCLSTWASASVLKGRAETGNALVKAQNDVRQQLYISHLIQVMSTQIIDALYGLLAGQTSGTRQFEFVASLQKKARFIVDPEIRLMGRLSEFKMMGAVR